MNPESDDGIILRVHPLTETSLVVRWLTAANGRIATVARGARNPKSPFAGRLDLFLTAALSFQRSRRSELHTLREVSVIGTFSRLRTDFARLTQASYAVGLVELVTETETPVPEIHQLCREFLRHLEMSPCQPRSIYALEARLLALGGLDPAGAEENPDPETLHLITALRDSAWADLEHLKPGPETIRKVNRLLVSQLRESWGRLPRGRDEALGG
ncbi:MAG: DNA repair protein RecO [Verrucomicrobiales bacterium]|nr:DNA repair protein RecO [Verrucomicrobiales bacterium]